MRAYFLPLALLFIAFTVSSIAQKTAPVPAVPAVPAEAAERERERQVVVAEGSPLTVECELGVEQRAEWRADGGPPAGDLRAGDERALPAASGRGRLVARLHAARARPAHAALYTCAPAANPVRVRVLPAPSTTVSGDSTAPPSAPHDTDLPPPDLVRFNLSHRLDFNCALSDPTADVEYNWFKNGSALTELGKPRGPFTENKGSVLVFLRAHEDDYGSYSCAVGGEPVRSWQAVAHALARVPANTNVVEGQKFSITCKLIGKPYPQVSWSYSTDVDANRTTLDTTPSAENRFSSRDSPAGVPGGVLEVRDAQSSDAGVYWCEPAEGTPAYSTLRVKDVYAALWPFLGICLEVFILCGIILVYEKRRTKPELDDSDADTHDQTKDT